ncbi:MAG TPA: tetratricopeptide repeat protein [Tepidisphaeraceae bacterium]|jgi:tetratricopeptide (TPR) repeat protein
MRNACLIVGLLLSCATAKAQIASTVDEWAARFAPEAGPAPALPAYADGYDRAAANLSAGRYRAALCDIAELPPNDPARSALLRARALVGLGEVDSAFALLTRPPLVADLPAIIFQGQICLNVDTPDDALGLADKALERDPESYAARLLKAQALEKAGQYPEAVNAYRWFLDAPQDLLRKWRTEPDTFEDAGALTDFATALHRWATLTRAYKETPQLNDTVLAMYTRAFDVIDRGYDRARAEAAAFCFSRGDGEKAAALLGPLEKRSPRSPELLRVTTMMAAASGNEAAMQGVIDLLRDNDPESADASLLEVQTLAQARSPAAVVRAAALYKRWDDRLDVAGTYAGLCYLSGDETGFKNVLAKADEKAPTRPAAYMAAAETFEAAYTREPAVPLLKTAIERTPWEAAPRHLLGDLYLNDGYNDQARTVLDEAYAIDPYHVKTINFLRLLDDLAKYDVRTTEHFITYADKEADPISAEQISDYLEEVYADVCDVFDYQPKTKVIVQIYPADDAFSVRMAGVPGVENYGVSFGRVLAAIAPRKGTKQGNFNWARVLRHEFVHTINLLQTNQRCPRWLTEGLAVWQEKVPFRFPDVPAELYRRTFADELFTVRGFPLAFIRPRRPADGEQAYTQGAYLAMYLDETFGRSSIVKLLNAYGAGSTDEAAFRAATGKPMSQVESGWHEWMKTKLKPWGYDETSAEKVKALTAEGEQFIKAKQLPEALKAYQAVHALQPMSVQPNQRLAGLYLQKALSDPAKAIEHLKFLHVLELQDNRYAKQISRLYARDGDNENAAKWAREATFVDLYDAAAHDLLAEAYAKLGRDADAEREKQAAMQVRLWDEKRKAAAEK